MTCRRPEEDTVPTASGFLTVEDLEQRGMLVPEVRFADEIERFVAADVQAPPAPGGILFVGDSDIRLWMESGRFAADFAGLPVVNRGFGGARTWEVLLYFAQLVLPSGPHVIVYCAGDNDIARLKERGAASAVLGFRLFLEQVALHVPETSVVFYLAIHHSPVDAPLWGAIDEANVGLRRLCDDSPLARFVDYLHLLSDERGQLRTECFRPDRLHFTADFYRELADFLRPRIEAAGAAGRERNHRGAHGA
jgi:lysophospholipase L1-like esterase